MHSGTPLDNEEFRASMTETLFQWITKDMQIGDRIARAAALVLVDGKSQKEVVEAEGVSGSHLSETLANITRRWEKLADQNGLVYVGVALHQSQVAGVLNQEQFNLTSVAPSKKAKSKIDPQEPNNSSDAERGS